MCTVELKFFVSSQMCVFVAGRFIQDMGGEVSIYQLADAANIRVDEAVLLARRYSSVGAQTMSAVDVRNMLEDSPHIKSRLLLMLSPVGKSSEPVD